MSNNAWSILFGALAGAGAACVVVGCIGFTLVKVGPRLLKRAMTVPPNGRKRVKV